MNSRAILILVFLGAALAVTPSAPTCTYGNLDFNPWDRWNLFVFNDIGTSANPMGADTQGRLAAGGNAWFNAFTARMISTGSSDTTPWSVTVGGSFSLLGGDVQFGGVEAGSVTIESASVEGDVHSLSGTAHIGAVNKAATIVGTVRAPLIDIAAGSSAGAQEINNALSLSVTLADVKAYFTAASLEFSTMTESTGGADLSDPNDIKVTLNAGLNVLKVTQLQLETASRLIICGDATGTLVLNVAGAAASLTNLDVYECAAPATPSFGRVLVNFYEATTLTFQLSGHLSVLAPLADATYTSGVVTGTVVVKSLTTGGGAQINILPWGGCPPPVAPSAPGVGQEIPSPPEECPPCPWEELGFNPWELWNVFSLGNIGSSLLPFGSDFQGRLAAVGSAWLQAFSFHDIAQAPTSVWSATVGGDFTLWGGSVSNGGVEAGNNVLITSADVAGDVHAVGGDATIGGTNAAVSVAGSVRAGGSVAISPESDVSSFVQGDNSLALSVDLTAVANWFKAQSLVYAAAADYNLGVVLGPNPVDEITVTLDSGLNYYTVDQLTLKSASRLQITGAADGFLVINVAGESISFDALDVFVDGWVNAPTSGRVLINFYEAKTLTVEYGSGHLSILAPLADVVYKSGVYTGNWVVGSLISQWTGGTQVNVMPWVPPCPPCPTEEIPSEIPSRRQGKAQGKAQGKSQGKSFAQQKTQKRVNNAKPQQRKSFVQAARNQQQNQQQQQQQHQGMPQWVMVAGGLVAGVAMSALVVAGIAIRRLSDLTSKNGQKKRHSNAGNVPATPSGNVFSPQSTVSHRGRGQFPTSP